MKPSEEEHSSVSSSSEFLICEDPEPERPAKLSQQAKSSSPSVAILNSREHSSNLSSTITKRVQPESSLASNLVFKSKSQHSSSSSHDIRQAKKSIIPTDGIKSDSSGSRLSSPSITRIEESLTASKRSINLCNQSLAENLPPKINTTSIPTNVKAEKRGTNSIHVETDSSIEIGKSSVSRFIDRQSSKGSRSPSSSPKTRIRSVYVKSDTLSTSSNSSSDESVDVPYHTLTRLNSCPACSDEWNTYKAPRSKLTHIKKCARTNLIRPKDIINRIQAILDKQIQNDPDPSSLLDLHIQNKNVQVNILEGDPQVQTSLKPDLLCRPPQQSRSHPSNSSISGDVQRSNGDTEKVNPQCTSSVSKSGDNLLTSSPPDLIHRSSLLAQARSRSCTRNSLIPNDGKTPYNLWNAAGGHDGFDFQRSVVSPVIIHNVIIYRYYPMLILS
ncbi:hypothetical protein DFH28DRAFT_658473 [Melampsora americana]|nr:hypothetical protein DFH28DRAFT_658473 [Melampsora americana]